MTIAILIAALFCATTIAAYLWLCGRELERTCADQQAQLDAQAQPIVTCAQWQPQRVTVCDPRKADWVVGE